MAMIPHGEVGLVFAGVGSASGVLSKPLETAIIMMVILTTFLAPPVLRFVFPQEIVVLDTDVSTRSRCRETLRTRFASGLLVHFDELRLD